MNVARKAADILKEPHNEVLNVLKRIVDRLTPKKNVWQPLQALIAQDVSRNLIKAEMAVDAKKAVDGFDGDSLSMRSAMRRPP